MPGNIVVTEYISLDGVIEDPVGMEGSRLGNWTGPFSRGLEGDQFKLEEILGASAQTSRDASRQCGLEEYDRDPARSRGCDESTEAECGRRHPSLR